MLLAVVLGVVALAIVAGAVRIILGWILPASATTRLDAFAGRLAAFCGKLFVVSAAALILWLVWYAATH